MIIMWGVLLLKSKEVGKEWENRQTCFEIEFELLVPLSRLDLWRVRVFVVKYFRILLHSFIIGRNSLAI